MLSLVLADQIITFLFEGTHHFHYILKDYQMDSRYSEVQEMEANMFGQKNMEGYKSFKCIDSL